MPNINVLHGIEVTECAQIDIPVVEGSPVAQQAFYSFDFQLDDIPMQIARRYCHGCTFLDPIAVPIVIHRKDIEKIAPLWLKKTVEIRAARPPSLLVASAMHDYALKKKLGQERTRRTG
jgi:hypothetical protein